MVFPPRNPSSCSPSSPARTVWDPSDCAPLSSPTGSSVEEVDFPRMLFTPPFGDLLLTVIHPSPSSTIGFCTNPSPCTCGVGCGRLCRPAQRPPFPCLTRSSLRVYLPPRFACERFTCLSGNAPDLLISHFFHLLSVNTTVDRCWKSSCLMTLL